MRELTVKRGRAASALPTVKAAQGRPRGGRRGAAALRCTWPTEADGVRDERREGCSVVRARSCFGGARPPATRGVGVGVGTVPAALPSPLGSAAVQCVRGGRARPPPSSSARGAHALYAPAAPSRILRADGGAPGRRRGGRRHRQEREGGPETLSGGGARPRRRAVPLPPRRAAPLEPPRNASKLRRRDRKGGRGARRGRGSRAPTATPRRSSALPIGSRHHASRLGACFGGRKTIFATTTPANKWFARVSVLSVLCASSGQISWRESGTPTVLCPRRGYIGPGASNKGRRAAAQTALGLCVAWRRVLRRGGGGGSACTSCTSPTVQSVYER